MITDTIETEDILYQALFYNVLGQHRSWTSFELALGLTPRRYPIARGRIQPGRNLRNERLLVPWTHKPGTKLLAPIA